MLSRRQMLIRCGALGASLSAHSWATLARGNAPSNRIRVGVIGTGVRGKYLIGNLPKVAQVVSICDCATSRMTETLEPKREFKEILADFRAKQAHRCTQYQDYRSMLDREKLDAVIIATPDHHHISAALHAIHAGLDVYVEKPLSLTIREGRLLADSVKRASRILQVGSQQRTMEVNRFACEFIRDGGLGKVTRVDVPNYPGPMMPLGFSEEPIPAGLDWDLFLGPAALRNYNRKLWIKDEFRVGELLWRGWDLFRDYSGHLVTNWGGHSLDMVQYALGMDESGPMKVELLKDISEAALLRDWTTKWHKKTPKPSKTFKEDSRFLPVRLTYGNGVQLNLLPDVDAAVFHGERGKMTISRNKFKCDPVDLVKFDPAKGSPSEAVLNRWEGSGHVARPHLENWLDCIVSRKEPHATVEIGHRSATVCHLVNIVRELNRPLHWNPTTEKFEDDVAANDKLDRPRRDGFDYPK